jgi:hypothetical protein|tara:strand:+ start:2207 stop:2608 length:402 start_codon:yes stop_codon:yes gene_type:complete
MASVSDVRSVVDSVIGAFLGEYNLPDGSTSPALWVRGSQQVPKDWTITGTECVIDEVPEARNLPVMSGQAVLRLFWTVTLTSYDTTKTLDSLRLLLFQAFPDMDTAVHTPQTDISFESLKVTIPDYSTHKEIL